MIGRFFVVVVVAVVQTREVGVHVQDRFVAMQMRLLPGDPVDMFVIVAAIVVVFVVGPGPSGHDTGIRLVGVCRPGYGHRTSWLSGAWCAWPRGVEETGTDGQGECRDSRRSGHGV